MEHILHSGTDAIDFTRYSSYIDSIRHKLPAHVYAFASNARYFDLTSRSSLHDAWLEGFSVREETIGEPCRRHRVQVT